MLQQGAAQAGNALCFDTTRQIGQHIVWSCRFHPVHPADELVTLESRLREAGVKHVAVNVSLPDIARAAGADWSSQIVKDSMTADPVCVAAHLLGMRQPL